MVSHRTLLTYATALALCVAVPVGVAWAANSGGGSSSGGSSSSGGGNTSSKSPEKMYQKASAEVKDGDYEDAIDILEDIVRKDPRNADAWNLMGYSHRKLGDYDEALEYYGKALKLKPNHIGANEYLGELYLEMKDLPKAEERLAVLTKACNGCEEQKELEEKIADFKANNG